MIRIGQPCIWNSPVWVLGSPAYKQGHGFCSIFPDAPPPPPPPRVDHPEMRHHLFGCGANHCLTTLFVNMFARPKASVQQQKGVLFLFARLQLVFSYLHIWCNLLWCLFQVRSVGVDVKCLSSRHLAPRKLVSSKFCVRSARAESKPCARSSA